MICRILGSFELPVLKFRLDGLFALMVLRFSLEAAMGSEAFLAIGALLFSGLSIPLFVGRGSWLVAGFNTMTPDQRARYDERKLCRSTGFMLLGVSVACVLMACAAVLEGSSAEAFDAAGLLDLLAAMVLILDIVIGVWYASTKCFRA